jgi:uncharacterized protein (DUF924 family)
MDAEEILLFWFGNTADDGLTQPPLIDRWFRKSDAFDAEIRHRFLGCWQAIMAGEHEAWLAQPRSRLAYVIVLDQFSRNMFRGQPAAFSGDPRVLVAVHDAVARGLDQLLPGHLRIFLYMPYMHSEQLEDQEQCIALFVRFRDQSQGVLREMLTYNIGFAEQHRDIIARFGRFPHRNQVLGRPSTSDELSFLQEPGSSF